jgi:hypothetical protein
MVIKILLIFFKKKKKKTYGILTLKEENGVHLYTELYIYTYILSQLSSFMCDTKRALDIYIYIYIYICYLYVFNYGIVALQKKI